MALGTSCVSLLITAVLRAESLASYSPAFSPSVTGVVTVRVI